MLVGEPAPLPPAAAAHATATTRRPTADAAPGRGDAGGPRGDGAEIPAGRPSSGAPDPSGRSGTLVDVFA
jgi:hypothetical protein